MTEWYRDDRHFARFNGLDPDVEWLLAEDAAQHLFLRKSLAIPDGSEPPFAFLLAPVEGGATGEALLCGLNKAYDGTCRFNMSKADRDRLAGGAAAGALCDAAFVHKLNQSGFAGLDKSMKLSSALPSVAAPAVGAEPFEIPPGLDSKLKGLFPGEKVVIGVIDDGFAIAHPRLRLVKDRTRVASYWDQEAEYAGDSSTVPFGRELLKIDFNSEVGLDSILGDYGGPMPEIYADSRLARFYPKKRNMMPRNTSHGTAVLDLAAGSEMGTGADRPVVAVKLPRESVLDTSGAHLEYFLLQGVHHILSRAAMLFGNPDREKSKPRVIIVASYGFFGGPLDGSSLFERAIDHVIATHNGRVQIVLPSGNGRMVRAHAVRPNNGKIGTIHKVNWRSPAGDRTPSVMEIWSEPMVGDPMQPAVALTLVTPDGLSSKTVFFNDSDISKKLVLKLATDEILAQAVCDHPPLHPGRKRFLIWLAPTALPPPDVTTPTALSSSGIWKIRLENLSASATKLSVWIRRDDSLPDFPRLGRQSSIERDPPQEGPLPLNQAQWDRWDNHGTASATATISSIATGQLTVVACGFGAADKRPARSAAGGPVALMAYNAPVQLPGPTARRAGPDCLAPSRVTSLRGIKAANFFGGTKVSLSGTSLASPLLGHWLAGIYLGGVGKFDGREKAVVAAHHSDDDMPLNWKPAVVRGDYRFLTQAMLDRTFRYDNASLSSFSKFGIANVFSRD